MNRNLAHASSVTAGVVFVVLIGLVPLNANLTLAPPASATDAIAAAPPGQNAQTATTDFDALSGGKWSWWACAAWAALTTTQCLDGNVVGCAAMLITYSQNC